MKHILRMAGRLTPSKSRPSFKIGSIAFPILAAVFALSIFALHTFWNNHIAIGVLYLTVILATSNVYGRLGITIVAAACIALEMTSFIISDGPNYGADFIGRCLISVLAVAITTVLVLKMKSVTNRFQDQAKLLDLTNDAIFVRTMDDVITYWNCGAEKLYGWPQQKALGRIAPQLVQTRFPIPRSQVFDELLSTGRWEGELVHVDSEQKEVLVASRWSLQTDEKGRPAAILETDTDITASRHALASLTQTQAELAHVARIATLGELTTTIAHEVNQPLTGIVTNGEACLRWLGRDELQIDEITGAVKRMVRDGRRAADVVERLRSLSKKSEPQRSRVNLHDLIKETVSLFKKEMSSAGVILSLELATPPLTVEADRVQLQQVLINLIMNAIQSMASAGSEPSRELRIRTGFLNEGKDILIAITDSGCGIDTIEDHLFSAFFTTKSDGIGMGLSICRSIIEAHRGRIWASCNDPAGTTFQFTLPAQRK